LPQVPLIIPLVVAGVFMGGVWYRKNSDGLWKKALLASAASGVLNSGYALLLGYLKISGTNTSSNTDSAFLITSGLSGFLIVIMVFLSAIVTIKYKRGKELEPEE
jgi:hypothetical protein